MPKAVRELGPIASVRVPDDWPRRFERIAAALSRPGITITSTAAHRAALARGLDELEAELFGAKEAPKK